MALAGRSGRRGGAGKRWLAAGIVLTLFVLLIDASLKSRSPGPVQQVDAAAWLDRVLPVVGTSNQEGAEIRQVWANGLHLSAQAITSQLDQAAAGAQRAYDTVVGLRPPATAAGAAGLLEACLLTRATAAASLRDAFSRQLHDPGNQATAQTSATIETAGQDLQVADRAYALFVTAMPKLGVSLPPSVWVDDPGTYQPAALQVFLTSLLATTNLAPVHKLAIYGVTTTPAPVSTQGGVEVLPDAHAITVTIVVADVGNQPERNLTVTAAVSPAAGTSSVRDFVNLVPGQAYTIVGLGPLNPVQGPPVTLTVTLTGPQGSAAAPVTQTVTLQMPAPPPPTTTSTTSTTTTGSSRSKSGG